MRVGVDARALLAGRGVSRVTRGCSRRWPRASPPTSGWRARPGRAPVAPVDRRAIVRHRLAGRILRRGRGRAAARRWPAVGGADVVWLPAPAPRAPGVPYVLTVHDLSWERFRTTSRAYERAWHALARLRRLAPRAAG